MGMIFWLDAGAVFLQYGPSAAGVPSFSAGGSRSRLIPGSDMSACFRRSYRPSRSEKSRRPRWARSQAAGLGDPGRRLRALRGARGPIRAAAKFSPPAWRITASPGSPTRPRDRCAFSTRGGFWAHVLGGKRRHRRGSQPYRPSPAIANRHPQTPPACRADGNADPAQTRLISALKGRAAA